MKRISRYQKFIRPFLLQNWVRIISELIFQNWFPKFEDFDWLIAKLVLILANRNTQIWVINFDKNQFRDDSALVLVLVCYEKINLAMWYCYETSLNKSCDLQLSLAALAKMLVFSNILWNQTNNDITIWSQIF